MFTPLIQYSSLVNLNHQIKYQIDFISSELETIIGAMNGGNFNDDQVQIKNCIMVFLGIIVYPMCLIKDFHNIRFLGITLFFVEQLVLGYVMILALYVGEFKVPEQQSSLSFEQGSGWMNLISYSRVYFFHAFYMIGYQYLCENKKSQVANQVSWISSFIILINSIQYGLSDVPSLRNNPNIYLQYNLWYELGRLTLVFIQIPFKFYICKECIFVIYDELRNRGLSSKINDLKAYANDNAPYSLQMVAKIREDLYEVVRMPFLKFSRQEYILISTIIYSLTIPPIIILHLWRDDSSVYLREHWEALNLNCAIIEPVIVFIISGYYYQKVALHFDIKQVYQLQLHFRDWTVRLAFVFQVIGIFATVIFICISFYRISNIIF
ncbi:UNKNOWN [Stylonychia lemnae]|uniref:Uncharacterized protein n=1 Tax=Stylonychia lemnae TaxID=5949 RepID=A0A078A3Q1_STYLE|nr:UNKNOWN [Stylonychia lemnae]|eukprot:CDW76158.1 UNKNOWN [Stylonychia lemnae]